MEKEKAIEYLNDVRNGIHIPAPGIELPLLNDKEKEAIDLAISALEKQEQDRWIPVTERLPELTHFMYDVTPFSDTVLVTVRNQYGAERLVLGNYEQHRGWNLELLDSTDERFLWHVIAWRPLPEAYTEEDNDQ